MNSHDRLTEAQINAKLDRYFRGNVRIDYVTYVNKAVKAKFVYQDNGEEFWAKAENVWNGHGSARRKSLLQSVRKRLSIDRVKHDIELVHGDQVSIVEKSYTCASLYATFIDKEFGEWIAPVSSVRQGAGHPNRIVEKRKRTTFERFGVEYILQNKEVYDRARKKRWNTTQIIHWKTHCELDCTASYEVAFVNWCNLNHIDFDWQITHKLPDGRVYIIDAFVKDGEFANTWIEIKGWLTGSTKEKWEWFHMNHPNDSQLWTRKILKEKGILP